MPQTAPQNPNIPTYSPGKNHEVWKPTKKQLIGGSLAVLALTGALFGGKVASKFKGINNVSTIEASATQITPQAQAFAEQYIDRYDDPISTYYANEAIVNPHGGKGYILPDDYVSTVEIKSGVAEGATSDLGFDTYQLPENAPANQETSLKIFNDYTCKELTNYINGIAKNPSGKARDIVDTEFRGYCSEDTNPDNPRLNFSEDDQYINKMMQTIASVVDKYGSNSNYTVLPGVIADVQSKPGENSFFDVNDLTMQETDDNGRVVSFSNAATVVIQVETYKGQQVTTSYEPISMQLSIIRQHKQGEDSPVATISIGQL